jgi:chitodextrinase
MDVEYGYTASTTDPDGDQIRYRFDWGDGTLSDWSELADSGATASLYHSWTAVDTYQVKAIAQDEHGLNGSWSALLNVTVSGVNDGGELPVANIVVPDDLFANQTIAFDASGSYDSDGIIVSYLWDFGDGTTGVGAKPVHEYIQPGTYLVTLVITDNSGNTYTEQITITVAAGTDVAESELQQRALSINLPLVLVGSVIAALLCLLVVFRNRIEMFVLDFQINSLSQYDSHKNKQIKKGKAKPRK